MRIACHYSTLSTNRRLRLVVLLLGHHGLRGIACSSCRCGALRGRIIHRFARGSRVSCSSRSSSCAASSTCASTSSWFWWHCCCGCVKGQGPKWWLEKVANILAIDKTPRIKRAPPPPPRNATSHVRVRGACFKSLVLVLYIHTHALVALSNSHGGGGFCKKYFFPITVVLLHRLSKMTRRPKKLADSIYQAQQIQGKSEHRLFHLYDAP